MNLYEISMLVENFPWSFILIFKSILNSFDTRHKKGRKKEKIKEKERIKG